MSVRITGIESRVAAEGCDINIAKRMAGHSNVKTTELYDRRGDEVSFSEIERVGILRGGGAFWENDPGGLGVRARHFRYLLRGA
jgi:hypothetical protein